MSTYLSPIYPLPSPSTPLLVDHTKIQKFLDLSVEKARIKITGYFYTHSTFLLYKIKGRS